MINEIKSEITFLKTHNLNNELWKESALQLIKRLTSDIKVKNKIQKEKLLEEVRDFVAKGKGNDDSFDFIFQEDKKFFREVHIYHHKDRVVARIDRTIEDEDGQHKPFENFITIEYKEDKDENLTAESISILGTRYVPFPANLIFGEHMFANMAGDIVEGINHKKTHYQDMEQKTITEVPDLFATPEQKEKNKEVAEDARYKIWDKKKQGLKGKTLDKKDFEGDVLMFSFLSALQDSVLKSVNTEGLNEEDIFRNLVSGIHAKNAEQQRRLKRQTKEFFDPNFGNDSFDMKKNLADGALIYEIGRNRKNNNIRADIKFAPKQASSAVKHIHYLDIVHMLYVEDPDNPGEFELDSLTIMGRSWGVGKEWEKMGVRFYNYLTHELSKTDGDHFDISRASEVLDLLEDERNHPQYISAESVEEIGVLGDDHYTDDKEFYDRKKIKQNKQEELRIKKKYESLYDMALTPK